MVDTRIRTVVTGATGRMGSALIRVVRDDQDMVVVGGTERAGSPSVGLDLGLAIRLGALEVPLVEDLDKAVTSGNAQVVIDFTSSAASLQHARICAERNVALVVGSTGFEPSAKEEIARISKRIPIVMSPNMSLGVNLVIKTAREMAQLLGESFDIEIVETHHRMKKDAPSGTALRLASEIAEGLGRSKDVFKMSRQGDVGARPRKEIGIQTLRGGDVVGEHTVLFLGEGERIELTHRATSRDQFAKGAVRAARWVVDQKPGLYDMQHVLGI